MSKESDKGTPKLKGSSSQKSECAKKSMDVLLEFEEEIKLARLLENCLENVIILVKEYLKRRTKHEDDNKCSLQNALDYYQTRLRETRKVLNEKSKSSARDYAEAENDLDCVEKIIIELYPVETFVNKIIRDSNSAAILCDNVGRISEGGKQIMKLGNQTMHYSRKLQINALPTSGLSDAQSKLEGLHITDSGETGQLGDSSKSGVEKEHQFEDIIRPDDNPQMIYTQNKETIQDFDSDDTEDNSDDSDETTDDVQSVDQQSENENTEDEPDEKTPYTEYEDIAFLLDKLEYLLQNQQVGEVYHSQNRQFELLSQCVRRAEENVNTFIENTADECISSEWWKNTVEKIKNRYGTLVDSMQQCLLEKELEPLEKDIGIHQDDEKTIEDNLTVYGTETFEKSYDTDMCNEEFSIAIRSKLAEVGLYVLSESVIRLVNFILGNMGCRTGESEKCCQRSSLRKAMLKMADVIGGGEYSTEDAEKSVRIMLDHSNHVPSMLLKERIIKGLGPQKTGHFFLKVDSTVKICSEEYTIDMIVV